MSAAIVEAKCPYCGCANRVQVNALPEAYCCDVDNGGCDRWFAVQVKTTVTHEVRVAKCDFDPEPQA